MRKTAFVLAAATVCLVSAQEPQRSVSEFFNDFTTEWMRANPNLAAGTRYFSGPETGRVRAAARARDAGDPTCARPGRARGPEEAGGLRPRARMTETERESADLMRWQLDRVVEGEKYSDYFFPLEQFGGANVGLPNILIVGHPLNTEKDAEHYVARLGAGERAHGRSDRRGGRLAAKNMIPPRFIIRATIAQMQQFIATPPAKNPFVAVFDQRARRGEGGAPTRDGKSCERRPRRSSARRCIRRGSAASRCCSRSSARRTTMRGCGGSRAARRRTRSRCGGTRRRT